MKNICFLFVAATTIVCSCTSGTDTPPEPIMPVPDSVQIGWKKQTVGRWSVEKAQAWGEDNPWYCGVNFVPSNAINDVEIWSEESDIITFHAYRDAESTRSLIDDLSVYGRPMICTEWLHRPIGCTIRLGHFCYQQCFQYPSRHQIIVLLGTAPS